MIAGCSSLRSVVLFSFLTCAIPHVHGQTEPPIQTVLAPRLILTGLVAFDTNKWITVTEVRLGGVGRRWILREGDHVGDLEVLKIDAAAGTVVVTENGRLTPLRFRARSEFAVEASEPARDSVRERLEFARSHAAFHEKRMAEGR